MKYVLFDLDEYINMSGEPHRESTAFSWWEKLENRLNLKKERQRFFVKRAVCELGGLVITLKNFFESDSSQVFQDAFSDFKQVFSSFIEGFNQEELRALTKVKVSRSLVHKYDYIFRNMARARMRMFLNMIYDLDALNAVAKGYKRYNFVFPIFYKDDRSVNMLLIEQVYHPALENPVKNDICINNDKQLVFLTGANMNGKSTLLRSIGVCIYLAHMGFPVPAQYMETRLYSGLLSTINLGDSVREGYSHFFNEVNRIKFICDNLALHNNIVVILDELFKGTNYQDASEATLELMDVVKEVKQSVFFISSHITEVVEKFHDLKRIDFKHMFTHISGDRVEISYKLREGIATEKLGMWLLNKNKTFDKIRKAT